MSTCIYEIVNINHVMSSLPCQLTPWMHLSTTNPKLSPKIICKYFYMYTITSHIYVTGGYCCVRQCGTSFPFCILGVVALIFNFGSSLHNTCSSSGSLFFTHLGGIIFIVHYISKFITDPIIYTYIVYLLHNCTIT